MYRQHRVPSIYHCKSREIISKNILVSEAQEVVLKIVVNQSVRDTITDVQGGRAADSRTKTVHEIC